MSMTCGEATMRLLARYGVTTVFGVPGVHTLDLCRGMSDGEKPGAIRHVQARNEQGAGFMAEGWARATGEVGVAVVISGPGVTNAATALGQCHADSLPMLLISAEPDSRTLGKGWGVLHEITEQRAVTAPLTAFSATARRASDVPELLARAFATFSGRRPRPVHISLPTDVQAEVVTGEWQVDPPPAPAARPVHMSRDIVAAAELLRSAAHPVLMVGGGSAGAADDLTAIAETLGAIVVCSNAGKGVVADDHPLSLAASLGRPMVRETVSRADVILAVGTELSETDSFIERLDLRARLVRVDIDAAKIGDLYPPEIGIHADAGPAMAALRAELEGHVAPDRAGVQAEVARLRGDIVAGFTPSEQRHLRLLTLLGRIAPPGTIYAADSCQQAYTGSFALPVRAPRHWLYPAGFCALGNALPNAIGAKLAKPGAPVVVLTGDGGVMFTVQELVTAAELGLNLPVIIWENGGLKQIQDDMDIRGITRVGVGGINPDFVTLARACHCAGETADDARAFEAAFAAALDADRPTVIVLREGRGWLA
ncbi:MAG: 5-guanidino-2-oxopentanoate decarboxylase [Paracoccaceae bacterium]